VSSQAFQMEKPIAKESNANNVVKASDFAATH
jgi:hypothetical protein